MTAGRTWHVVGDRFAAFAKNPQVVTTSALLGALRGEGPFDFPPGARFLAGQGLLPEQVAELLRLGRGGPRAAHFADFRVPEPASAALAHKKQVENILISAPLRTAPGTYEAELILHERNGIFADRTTGQHVEGLILVEAARQLGVAATEVMLIAEHGATADLSFVVTVLNQTFQHFVFPIETRLGIKIAVQAIRLDGQTCYSCHSVLTGSQLGRTVFQQEGRYVVFPRAIISATEAQRAAEAARWDGGR